MENHTPGFLKDWRRTTCRINWEQAGNLRVLGAGGTWSFQCSGQKHSSWRETWLTRSTLFQTGTPHLGDSSNRTRYKQGRVHSLEQSGNTLIVVRFFEGIQPIEAEHLFPVRPLHQGELAGVELDLHWSRAGSAVVLLSPRTFHLAGVGKGKSRGNVRFNLQIPSWNRGTQCRRSLKRTQLVNALRQNGIMGFCFRLHFNRHLLCC